MFTPDQRVRLGSIKHEADNRPKSNGSYQQKAVPQDPWGHPYNYRTPGSRVGTTMCFRTERMGRPAARGECGYFKLTRRLQNICLLVT